MIPGIFLQLSRMNVLFEGARDAYAPFLRICLVAPLDEIKPKMENSLNRYLPVFEKVGKISR